MHDLSLELYDGEFFYIKDGKPSFSNFNIETLCHSLERQIRFNGHVNEYYTVGMHSFLGSVALTEMLADKDSGYSLDVYSFASPLYFALHDMHEAITGDKPSPLKSRADRVLEDLIQSEIESHFPFNEKYDRDIIKKMDTAMYKAECIVFNKKTEIDADPKCVEFALKQLRDRDSVDFDSPYLFEVIQMYEDYLKDIVNAVNQSEASK